MGHPQRGYVLVDEYVRGAGGGELDCCHRVHVGTAAEAVGEENNVGVAALCKGQRAKVVDGDDDVCTAG